MGMLSILLISLSTLTRAADCSNDNPLGTCGPALATQDDMWASRQSFCGDNQWETLSCITYNYSLGKSVTVKLSEPGANTQQVCWDALSDIIVQCYRDVDDVIGVYNYNGAEYSMDSCGTPC